MGMKEMHTNASDHEGNVTVVGCGNALRPSPL
jgi:hypothetical protein